MRLSDFILLLVSGWLQVVISGPTISERNLCLGKPRCPWPLSSHDVEAIAKRFPAEPIIEPHDPEGSGPEPESPDSGNPNSGNPNSGNPNSGNPDSGNSNNGNSPPPDGLSGSEESFPQRQTPSMQGSGSEEGDVGGLLINEVLPIATYQQKGLTWMGKLDGALTASPRVNTPAVQGYSNLDDRYTYSTEARGPLDPNPYTMDTDSTNQEVEYLQIYNNDPDINVDLRAADWNVVRLDNKLQLGGATGEDLWEQEPTTSAFVSESQESVVQFQSNKDLDPDGALNGQPLPPRLPISEQIFNVLERQNTRIKYWFRHPVANKGTVDVLNDIYTQKGIDLEAKATWTPADGDLFNELIGTRNGLSAPALLVDHAGDLGGLNILKVHTYAKIPNSIPRRVGTDLVYPGSMVIEIG
jgi:hypothetical protein